MSVGIEQPATKGFKKQPNAKALHYLCYYSDGGDSGGDVMTVVVLDDSGLLECFPVSHQRHGGMLKEVLVNWENENYEDKIKSELFSFYICMPFTSFSLIW